MPRVVLVTGAASGIGFAVSRALSCGGTQVAMCDRDAAALDAALARVRKVGAAPVQGFVVDVRERAAVATAVEQAEERLGPIEGVASVAGVLHLGAAVPSLGSAGGGRGGADAAHGDALSDSAWADSLAVNAGGLFHLAQTAVARMVARGRGALVTVASNAASTPRLGMGAYAASKAAAVMFTKCLGLEVARHGVRCNVVSPGSTDTPMQQAFWTGGAGGAAQVIAGNAEQYRLGIPLGRIADPDDVADAVLYLLSDRARHITMQQLCVDGGATL